MALTWVAGVIGGGLFTLIGAPLAWMLGAMTATTLLAMSGAPLAGSTTLRNIMAAVLGVLLGSSFSPEIVQKLPQWLGVVTALCVVLCLHGLVAFAYLRLKANIPVTDAYFSAAPGGLIEMMLQGDRAGGTVHTIALFHATRVLAIVAIMPLSFRLIGGVVPALPGNAHGAFSVSEALWLAGCAGVGLLGALRLKLPAPYIVGPLILSAIAHGAGLSHLAPPALLIAAAQVTIGTSIGARFTNVSSQDLRRVVAHGLISALIMIAVSLACGWIAAPLLGFPRAALILAFTPGGLAEMSLIALSMNIDPALVSAMHAIRILVVVLLATPVYHALTLWQARTRAAGEPTQSETTNS